MNIKIAWFTAILLMPLSLAAQTPPVITMDKEPHHHLNLQNEYVKVFKVAVSPGDSIALHRHDQDTVAVEEQLNHRAILDRKSTRLNSSHQIISYAVFCLKKKKTHDMLRSLS